MGGQGAKAGGIAYCEESAPTLKSAPSGSNTVPDVVYCIEGHCVEGFQNAVLALTNRGYVSGDITETIRSDPHGAYPIVLCVRERCGCEESGTIATSNDQFLVIGSGLDMSEISHSLVASRRTPTGTTQDNLIVTCVALDRAAYNQGANAQFDPGIDGESGKAFTVIAKGPGAVCYAVNSNGDPVEISDLDGVTLIPVEIILRRLTPTECARLQGMPDWYCDDIAVPDPTDEDMAFWREVFETHRRIVTQASKPKTDKQIRKWLANPVTDAAQYKMWGNGMALPCVLYVMEGIKDLLEEEQND